MYYTALFLSSEEIALVVVQFVIEHVSVSTINGNTKI